jgi:heat shock protein HtpX
MTNTLKTTVLLGVLSGLFLLIGELLGGAQGVIIAFLFAAVTNLVSYWFSDRIVLAMYRAKEVGPGHPLHQLVAQLAQRANLPMPRVYVIPDSSPNAFATGRNPSHAAVAATEGILQVLDTEELSGVIAHELAHVKHRDILTSSVAATLAAAIMMLARMALFFGGRDDRNGGSPVAGLLMLILAPIAAMLIQAAISRSREFAADAGARELVGSPEGLVRALRTIEEGARRVPLDANPATAHMFIVQPFSGQALSSLFSTHPPTEKRIAALLQR